MEVKIGQIARVHALRLGCRNHPQWDDILQEGALGALQSLARVPEAERDTAVTAAWVGAKEGIIHFLRSRQNFTRKAFASGAPTPEFTSWDALKLTGEDPPGVYHGDFAPALIHRLYCEAFWEEFWEGVLPGELPLVRRWFAEGYAGEVADKNGSSESYYHHRLNRVFNRFRRRYGVRETDANSVGTHYLNPAVLSLDPEDEDLRDTEEWLLDKQGWVYCRTPKRAGGGKTFLIRLIGGRMTDCSVKRVFCPENGDPFDLRRQNIRVMTKTEQKGVNLAAHKARDPDAFRARERRRYAKARDHRNLMARTRHAAKRALERSQNASADAA